MDRRDCGPAWIDQVEAQALLRADGLRPTSDLPHMHGANCRLPTPCNTLTEMRTFNTTGTVVPRKHYCVPLLHSVDLEEVLLLIQLERYFVLHAPRQTGKTSTLKALADYINASDEYRCLYVSIESGRAGGEDTLRVMRTLLGKMGSLAIETLSDSFIADTRTEVLASFGPDGALEEILGSWAKADPEPLVLLIDEVDSLVGSTLVSVLLQLRSGFDRRPTRFPQSVVLCGMRDLRDYRIRASTGGPAGGGPFNVAAKSLRLGDFSEGDVRALLQQHTVETAQEFETRASDRIRDLTRGQPWLVNALCYQACFDDKSGRDRSLSIGVSAIDRAKETMVRRRFTRSRVRGGSPAYGPAYRAACGRGGGPCPDSEVSYRMQGVTRECWLGGADPRRPEADRRVHGFWRRGAGEPGGL